MYKGVQTVKCYSPNSIKWRCEQQSPCIYSGRALELANQGILHDMVLVGQKHACIGLVWLLAIDVRSILNRLIARAVLL